MSTNKYYLIKKNISELFPNDCLEWELKPFNIIKDVGSNMFVARSVKNAIENEYCQLGEFSRDLVKILIKHNSSSIIDVSKEIE